jgi:chemotaxis-related protein WspB
MPDSPAIPQPSAPADPASVHRLLLLLAVGAQLYAIDTETVVEVIPQVLLRPLSGAPDHLRGVFNFRGRVVPVVDVTQLIAGEACADHLSSRIIMVRHNTSDGESALLGLLAERVTDTLLKPLASFRPAEGAAAQRPFLGGVALDERGLIQLLLCDRLAAAALTGLDPTDLPDPGLIRSTSGRDGRL